MDPAYDNIESHNICSYYDFDALRSALPTKCNSFVVLHQNIRSFHRNFDEFSALLEQSSVVVDVIVLTETWFRNNDKGIIDGYNGYHDNREEKRGGGVSIYVRSIYQSSVINNVYVSADICEVVAARIIVDDIITVNLLGVYRPPSGSAGVSDFNHVLSSNVLANFKSSDLVIVAGDFNINLIKRTKYEEEYMNVFRSRGFIPLIDKVTRVDAGSIIDHIWSNFLYNNKSGVIRHCVTDHYAVFTAFSLPRKSEKVRKYFRDHSSQCVNNLKVAITNFLYDFEMREFGSMNEKCSFFNSNFYILYDKHCPIRSKEISFKRLTKPWITSGIMKSINRKHKMFIQLRRGLVDLEEYNRYRNALSALLRRSRKDYFSEKFDNFNGNVAKSWKLLNTLLGRGGKSALSKDAPSADCFNRYFSSIAGELDSKIPVVDASPIDYMGTRVPDSFFADPCSVSEISSIISQFVTKGSPINEIPVFIYKSVCSIIAPYLVELFNESIESGTFPSCLKVARVVPIHKKDDPALPSNYRPISTLPVMSKLFELLMHGRIVRYLNRLNILSGNQFGFRAMRGTNDAIIDIYEHVFSSFEKSEHSVAVLLDFSKAFDTVSHRILLDKLEHIGVRGKCLSWFQSYLNERSQYVQVGSDSSLSTEIKFGVPQGSVLGPLLFIVYINDMRYSSDLLHFVHYADDSTVFLSHHDINELFVIIERELGNVVRWLSVNRLSINIGKTVYLLFSNQTAPAEKLITMNGVALKRVEDREFLGIIMEDKSSKLTIYEKVVAWYGNFV